MEYTISNHARERFLERRRSYSKYAHLRSCGQGCTHCVHLVYEMRDELERYRKKLDEEIINKLKNSEEISYNKDNFLTHMAETYGDDAIYRFFHSGDMIFVSTEQPQIGNVLMTCFDSKDSIFRDFVYKPNKELENTQSGD